MNNCMNHAPSELLQVTLQLFGHLTHAFTTYRDSNDDVSSAHSKISECIVVRLCFLARKCVKSEAFVEPLMSCLTETSFSI
jgi:hypothetical protein